MKTDTYRKGIFAEIYASFYLWVRGYRILTWRHKTKMGEVDIIARKGGHVIAVEVKARPNLQAGMLSISQTSRKRIQNAAQNYMNHHGLGHMPLRFDAVVITGVRIHHIKNAWGEDGFV
jgi:putative endonuclease